MEKETKSKVTPYQIFMFLLCVFVISAFAAEVTLPLDQDTREVLFYIDTTVCILFFVDFLYRLATAENRLTYLRWGWLDLISSIPTIGALRLARIFRLLRIIRVMRGLRSIKELMAVGRKNRGESAFLSLILVTLITVAFGSIILLHFERDMPNANITNIRDALWWSFVTITTVGYGEYYPISSEGRLIAAIMMTIGVGIFGTFTGFVATWFLEGRDHRDNRIHALAEQLKVANAANRELIRRLAEFEETEPGNKKTP